MAPDKTLDIIIKRVEVLEKWREEDRRDAAVIRQTDLRDSKDDRHDFRNEIAALLAASTIIANALQKQVTDIDKVSKIGWMRWAIGALTTALVMTVGYIFRVKQ